MITHYYVAVRTNDDYDDDYDSDSDVKILYENEEHIIEQKYLDDYNLYYKFTMDTDDLNYLNHDNCISLIHDELIEQL